MIIRLEAIGTIVFNIETKANSFFLPSFAIRAVIMRIACTFLGCSACLLTVVQIWLRLDGVIRFFGVVRLLMMRLFGVVRLLVMRLYGIFFAGERRKLGVIARRISWLKACAVVVTNVKTKAHRLITRNLAIRPVF